MEENTAASFSKNKSNISKIVGRVLKKISW